MFVGASRQQLVDELERAFSRVSEGTGPELHALIAAAGVGKTRLVQELYSRLVVRHGDSVWPSALTDHGDWRLDRKALRLPEEVGPGRPEFLWWVLDYQRAPGQPPSQVLFSEEHQLDAQLARCGRRLDRRPIAARRWDLIDTAIAALGLVVVLGGVSGSLLGTIAPGVGTATAIAGAVVLGLRAWTRRHAFRAVRFRAFDPGRTDEPQQRTARTLAEDVAHHSRSVPIVIVVDDAHRADSTLTTFLDVLLDLDGAHVLVITCSWDVDPDPADDPAPFLAWLDGRRRSRERHVHTTLRAVDALTQDEAATLVEHELAQVAETEALLRLDEATLAALREHVGVNPQLVRGVIRSEGFLALLRSGNLDPLSVRELPRDVEGLGFAYWRGLPPPVRVVLGIAAVTGQRYPVGPVLEVAMRRSATADADLDAARTRYRLVRELAPTVQTFIDGLTHRLASEQFRAGDLDLVVGDLAEAIERDVAILEEPPYGDTPVETLWSAHVALARTAAGVHVRARAARSAARLARDLGARGGYSEAIALAREAIAWSEDVNPEDEFRLEVAMAPWLRYVGRGEEALARLERVAARIARDREASQGLRVHVAVARGDLLIALGRHQDAALMLHELDVELGASAVSGSDTRDGKTVDLEGGGEVDTRDLWRAGERLAEALSRSGRFDEARSTLLRVAELHGRRGGSLAEVAALRLGAAKVLMRSRHAPEAVEELEVSLAELGQQLPPDHRQILRGRLLLVEALMRLGRSADAVRVADELCDLVARVRPPRHLDAIRARTRRCEALCDAGRFAEVLEHITSLISDAAGSIGRNNPSTLRIRGVRIEALLGRGGAEGVGLAHAEAVALAADSARVNGVDNADTMWAERQQGEALLLGGEAADAVTLLAPLLERASRVRGRTHPDALRVGRLLAAARQATGDQKGAEALRADLHARCVAARGPGDPICVALGSGVTG
jgi:tetratricopeptide (TPR) repeat protein